MKIRLSQTTLRPDKELIAVIVDIVMVVLITINLAWIIFDWIFVNPWVQDVLQRHVTGFFHFYNDRIHQHFLFYDLIFVSIFLTEIVVRWIISIKAQTYHRWYFYPFVHWYDVLGCIPIGSLRALRLLRIIALVMKLQKRGIIDIVFSVVHRIISDLAVPDRNEVVNELTNRLFEAVLEQPHDIDHVIREIALESIEVIKAHVRIQRWKELV